MLIKNNMKEGHFGGELSMLDKMRKFGGNKIIPILTTLIADTTGNSNASERQIPSIIEQTDEEIFDKPKVESAFENLSPEYGQDDFEIGFLTNIQTQTPEMKVKLLEQYRLTGQTVYNHIFESHFKSSEKNRDAFFKRIAPGSNLRKIIDETAVEYGIPESIAEAMAGVESGYLPNAQVRKDLTEKGKNNPRATGLFMLQQRAAKENGLTVGYDKKGGKIDDRFDPKKNAEAAMNMLGERYEVFDDWFFAVQSFKDGKAGLMKKLNALFKNLTLNDAEDSFDENGWKAYHEMLEAGSLNPTLLLLLNPEPWNEESKNPANMVYAYKVWAMLLAQKQAEAGRNIPNPEGVAPDDPINLVAKK
jgi:hypothetical protein